MNLTHDAMLVSLRINAWSGRLYDRQASRHVAIHHDASASAVDRPWVIGHSGEGIRPHAASAT